LRFLFFYFLNINLPPVDLCVCNFRYAKFCDEQKAYFDQTLAQSQSETQQLMQRVQELESQLSSSSSSSSSSALSALSSLLTSSSSSASSSSSGEVEQLQQQLTQSQELVAKRDAEIKTMKDTLKVR
jgi:archaellum component FlaC